MAGACVEVCAVRGVVAARIAVLFFAVGFLVAGVFAAGFFAAVVFGETFVFTRVFLVSVSRVARFGVAEIGAVTVCAAAGFFVVFFDCVFVAIPSKPNQRTAVYMCVKFRATGLCGDPATERYIRCTCSFGISSINRDGGFT